MVKADGCTIEAFCRVCRRDHLVITGWLTTEWADGPMEPVAVEVDEHPAFH